MYTVQYIGGCSIQTALIYENLSHDGSGWQERRVKVLFNNMVWPLAGNGP